ncbi:MAG: VOC family protein [Magnetococcales bacterium]|nr:VOC family protein [Magnetococcales bacterium]MBF0439544.1 VOC family protein [Magnetococcales bacterium]
MNHYTGIHHAAFATNDLTMTVRYWRDLLGLRLVYAYGRPGYRQYFFEIHGGSRVSFFEWPDVEKVTYKRHGEPVKGPFVFDHISIGVDGEEALWEMMARLDGAGFPVSDVIDHGVFYSIYSFDPNGIPVEFSCHVPGYDLNDHPVFQDTVLSDEDGLTLSDPRPGQWPDPIPIPLEERIIVPGEGKEFFP